MSCAGFLSPQYPYYSLIVQSMLSGFWLISSFHFIINYGHYFYVGSCILTSWFIKRSCWYVNAICSDDVGASFCCGNVSLMCTESSSSWHWWCSQSTHISAQTPWPILYAPTATMIQTLSAPLGDRHQLHCSTYEDEIWRQSFLCGWASRVEQFVTRTVYTLLNADSNRTVLACVLMIHSVMPFRSGFVHRGH